MKFEEALKLLREGKKIRNTEWRPSKFFIYLKEDSYFASNIGEINQELYSWEILGEWEEYKE